jgi:hypothetical protein
MYLPFGFKGWDQKQEVLGRTNFPSFPMAMVAIMTLAKDCMLRNHNNPTIKKSLTIAVRAKNNAST